MAHVSTENVLAVIARVIYGATPKGRKEAAEFLRRAVRQRSGPFSHIEIADDAEALAGRRIDAISLASALDQMVARGELTRTPQLKRIEAYYNPYTRKHVPAKTIVGAIYEAVNSG